MKITMANGDGRGGRQRETYKQYVERYINGTYSEDEQCVGGTQTGGGIMLWTSDTPSGTSTARTLTSGSRAARRRAEPLGRAICRAVIDGT